MRVPIFNNSVFGFPVICAITLLFVFSGASFAERKKSNRFGDTQPGKEYIYKISGKKERKMEIYFPPNHDPSKSKVPGLILFHGGGWSGGDLSQFRAACAYFASRGLVCSTAEYQCSAKKRTCIVDAKSAIRWFKQHAAELGVDPQRVITGGGSAGGHISALATLNPGLNDPADPKDIDTGVVAYLWFNPAFAETDSADSEIDVLQHLKNKTAPAIVFFGENDTWKKGWDTAYDKWKDLGVINIDLRIAPKQNHGFFNSGPWRTVTLQEADEFLVKLGLLSGQSTLVKPESGEQLIPVK